MGAPRHARFAVDFDEWFPEGLYLVGEIQAVTEYQSSEDRARNRPVRARVDEVSGLPLFRGTFADPAAEKDREKSVTVEFACAHQPVPPPAVPGVPFRPVALEGMTVAPRAEASGQAKWITWVIRATGMTAPAVVTSTNPPATLWATIWPDPGTRRTCCGVATSGFSRFAMVSRIVADGTLRRQTLTYSKIRSDQRLCWSTPVYRGSWWCPRQDSNLRHTV